MSHIPRIPRSDFIRSLEGWDDVSGDIETRIDRFARIVRACVEAGYRAPTRQALYSARRHPSRGTRRNSLDTETSEE